MSPDLITTDTRNSRGQRVLVAEPGNGTRYVLLLVDIATIPSEGSDALGGPTKSYLLTWLNPPHKPRPTTLVSAHLPRRSTPYLARELAISQDDALYLSMALDHAFATET